MSSVARSTRLRLRQLLLDSYYFIVIKCHSRTNRTRAQSNVMWSCNPSRPELSHCQSVQRGHGSGDIESMSLQLLIKPLLFHYRGNVNFRTQIHRQAVYQLLKSVLLYINFPDYLCQQDHRHSPSSQSIAWPTHHVIAVSLLLCVVSVKRSFAFPSAIFLNSAAGHLPNNLRWFIAAANICNQALINTVLVICFYITFVAYGVPPPFLHLLSISILC